MSIFNNDCFGAWDGSFETSGNKVIWTARTHPAIIFFNFLLPPDLMTGNVLPLLEERTLLGGISYQVAEALYEEYQDARTYLAPRCVADMAHIIIFLTRKRPDLEHFELLWCAAHTAVKRNLAVCEKYRKIPMVIRGRVKRDAITQFQSILHNPNFNYVGPLLGHALKALEVYVRPLVTDSSPFVWVDEHFLHNLHDIHELSVDGAKARKALFDYLQERHHQVETLWHSLVQSYNTHDVTHSPEYSTRPMSKPSLILWELFYRQARQDVPLEYPQSGPSAPKQKDKSSTLRGPVDEGEQKKSKSKKKKRSKSSRVVKLVNDLLIPKQLPPKDQPVSEAQPASQQQASAATVKMLPSSPAVQEPPEMSEQKLSKRERKNMRKKLKKLEAAERTKSSDAKGCQPSVIGNDDNNGDDVTDNNDDNGDSVISSNDGDSIISNNNDDNDVCLAPTEHVAEQASANEDPAQEDASDEEPTLQNSKLSVSNVHAGISAEKRTLHDSSCDNPYVIQEDYAKSSGSWQKVGLRKDLQQKQRQRKNDRGIDKHVPKAADHMSTEARLLPAKAKAPIPSVQSLGNETKPRSTKTKAAVLCQITSEPRSDNSNVTLHQPTSWSALFEGFEDRRRHPSFQHSKASTDIMGAQALATTGTGSHGSLQEDFPPLGQSPLVQSETPIDEDISKSSVAYSTTALLPPEDEDAPVGSPAVREIDMSHVEQWLASKYVSAFFGLTEAETKNSHWRPSNVTVVMDCFTFYRRDLEHSKV